MFRDFGCFMCNLNSRSTKLNEKQGDKEVGLCDTALHSRTDLVDLPTDTRNQTDEEAGGVKRRPVKLTAKALLAKIHDLETLQSLN